ncbi:MAG: transcription elongation factor GreAB [Proteobacteria bacterium]|nr:MAG: transcription elongation factor GreAB [Pseudomonadota bacterium]
MDKSALAAQLVAKVRESIAVAERELASACEAARHVACAKERREDNRMAIEYGGLANGQKRRVAQGRQILAMVESFHPRPIPSSGRVALGAVVEVEDEDDGSGRTFFLAPAGAGIELSGPGGDGFLSVVTPHSPMGRAVMGQELGDAVDVTVEGVTRSWEITWLE